MGADEPHVTELIGAYYMDALDDTEAATVRGHLGSCAACRAESVEVIDTIAAIGVLHDTALSLHRRR